MTLQSPIPPPIALGNCQPPAHQPLYGTQKGTGRVKPCTLHLTDVFLPPPMHKCRSYKPSDMTPLRTRLQHKRLRIVPCICRSADSLCAPMTDASLNYFSFRSTSPAAASEDSKLGSVGRLLSVVLLTVS